MGGARYYQGEQRVANHALRQFTGVGFYLIDSLHPPPLPCASPLSFLLTLAATVCSHGVLFCLSFSYPSACIVFPSMSPCLDLLASLSLMSLVFRFYTSAFPSVLLFNFSLASSAPFPSPGAPYCCFSMSLPLWLVPYSLLFPSLVHLA